MLTKNLALWTFVLALSSSPGLALTKKICGSALSPSGKAVKNCLEVTWNQPTSQLHVSQNSVAAGTHINVWWESLGTNLCTLTYAGGSVTGTVQPLPGIDVAINADTTFSLSCSGPGGNANPQTQTVTVLLPGTVALTVNGSPTPACITSNSVMTVAWVASPGFTDCQLPKLGWQTPGISWTGNVLATASDSYSVTCTGPTGSVTSNTVSFTVVSVALTINASHSPPKIAKDSNLTVAWTASSGFTDCQVPKLAWQTPGISWTGSTNPVTASDIYTVNCTGPNSCAASDTVAFTVDNPHTYKLKFNYGLGWGDDGARVELNLATGAWSNLQVTNPSYDSTACQDAVRFQAAYTITVDGTDLPAVDMDSVHYFNAGCNPGGPGAPGIIAGSPPPQKYTPQPIYTLPTYSGYPWKSGLTMTQSSQTMVKRAGDPNGHVTATQSGESILFTFNESSDFAGQEIELKDTTDTPAH